MYDDYRYLFDSRIGGALAAFFVGAFAPIPSRFLTVGVSQPKVLLQVDAEAESARAKSALVRAPVPKKWKYFFQVLRRQSDRHYLL